jgi:predicted metalloprotease with PDZ domain
MTDYYGHGSLVAFELDLRLRAADPRGDGLDTVFRTLWRRHAGTAEGYTEADVVAAVADVGGDALAELVEDRVADPGHPVLDDVVEAVGLRWVPKDDTPPPHLGVRAAESAGVVTLATVLRGGPAWRAGLTGGDRVVALDGEAVAAGHLEALLRTRTAGDEVAVTVTRGPRLITRTVTLGEPLVSHRLCPVASPSPEQRAAFAAWAGTPLDEVTG